MRLDEGVHTASPERDKAKSTWSEGVRSSEGRYLLIGIQGVEIVIQRTWAPSCVMFETAPTGGQMI
jgi:hypothetical protein